MRAGPAGSDEVWLFGGGFYLPDQLVASNDANQPQVVHASTGIFADKAFLIQVAAQDRQALEELGAPPRAHSMGCPPKRWA